jgi:copper chaperone CopZ
VGKKAMKVSRKQQYLITDNGFAYRLNINLLLISTILVGCTYIQPLNDNVIDIYYNINNYMMKSAHRLAWWSLLGLLSSSCCALQILLNALSFGCAGFNTVLGPIRPTFVAFTIVAQSVSWYVAFPRPYQWGVTAASTTLSSFLTLLPELLAWRATKREQMRQDKFELQDGKFAENRDSGVCARRLQFRIDTMGCISCVTTISNLLDGLEGVMSYKVSLEDGLAEVILAESSTNIEGSSDKHHERLWKDIAAKLELAGFPAESVDGSKKHR